MKIKLSRCLNGNKNNNKGLCKIQKQIFKLNNLPVLPRITGLYFMSYI